MTTLTTPETTEQKIQRLIREAHEDRARHNMETRAVYGTRSVNTRLVR